MDIYSTLYFIILFNRKIHMWDLGRIMNSRNSVSRKPAHESIINVLNKLLRVYTTEATLRRDIEDSRGLIYE